MKKFTALLSFFLLFQFIAGYSQSPITTKVSSTKHGPEKGSLLIIGGGKISPEIWSKFTELAGGVANAKIVVVTAAMANRRFLPEHADPSGIFRSS